MFSQDRLAMSRITPPSFAGEKSKSAKIFHMGVLKKNTKNSVINRETSFTKISSKNYPYGDFDENFKKLAGRLRVKCTRRCVVKTHSGGRTPLL